MEPIVKLETEIYRISRRRSRSLDNARYCEKITKIYNARARLFYSGNLLFSNNPAL